MILARAFLQVISGAGRRQLIHRDPKAIIYFGPVGFIIPEKVRQRGLELSRAGEAAEVAGASPLRVRELL